MGNILESAFFDNQGTIGGPSNPNTGEGLAAQRSNQIVLRDLAGALPIQSVSILDGTITPPNGAYLEIDTEGQAPADDLSVINSIRSESDTIHDGMILHVRAKEESRVVTLKNSNGINGIQTVLGADIVLNTTEWVKLMRTSGSWHEVREKTIGDASYTQKGIVQLVEDAEITKKDHTEAELVELAKKIANARQLVERLNLLSTDVEHRADLTLSNVTELSQEFIDKLPNTGGEYRLIYGLGQKAAYDPDNQYAIEDEALGVNGTISTSQRYVLDNPFGIDTPVTVLAELFINNKWAYTGIFNYQDGSSIGEAFTIASDVQGEGVIVQTARSYVATYSSRSGGGHGITNSINSAPCRVKVWKVGV